MPCDFVHGLLCPIGETEIELSGGLTILAGRNNTGKTYLAYTLYGFLKTWIGWPEARRLLLDGESSPLGTTDGFGLSRLRFDDLVAPCGSEAA